MGEEYQQPLIVAGKLDFESQNRSGFQPDERVVRTRPRPARASCAATATWSARASRLSADFYFIDGKTGELLHKEKFSEEVLYAEDQSISPLSSYFELMDRLLPNFLGVHHPAEDPRDARASSLGERRCAALRPLLLAALGASLLAGPAPASAQFIPYFGKNKVKYDNFAWRIYKSPHFEIYYYPEFEQHLARLASYAESAYQKISSGLKHEMPKPIPLILYKTHSEFEQTNLFPAFVPEGVAAFTEPLRNRMVLPIDEPPDRLQGLITHELTHVFEFDLIPRGLGFGISQQAIPLWVDEGLADYIRGIWEPLDLMMIRDAAVTDKVPKLSRAEFEALLRPRSSTTWATPASSSSSPATARRASGSSSTRCARASSAAATEELYKQAFRTTPEEFDDAFDKWLKERFKPFRDKQRPDDYGRDLSPNPEKTQLHPGLRLRAEPLGRDRGGDHRQPLRRRGRRRAALHEGRQR